MKRFKNKIKMISTVATFCIGFLFFIFITSASVQFVKAAYEEPTAEAPLGNIFVPLTTSSDDQAKKGFFQLNPLYNPYGALPDISYPLEVRGPNDVFINDLEVPSGGNFIVDTDTLYVDGLNSRVGVGTTTPATLLDIVGGGLTVGNATSPVSGAAISSISEIDYGIYGESTGANTTSVFGQSAGATGIGVYGFNLNGGTGIRADSTAASAVSGSSLASYDPAAAVQVAGVFGQAQGLGSWAGYFLQRVYGSEYTAGKIFTPNTLQYSQIPYTAAWEERPLPDLEITTPYHVAFDGKYLWISGYYWDTVIWVVEAETGFLIDEFIPDDAAGSLIHGISSMIYEDGYIWVGGYWDKPGDGCTPPRASVSRIDPNTIDPSTGHYEVVNYVVGPCNAGQTEVNDIVYDNVTPGGPYIWTVQTMDAGGTNFDYAFGRLNLSDYSYLDPVFKVSGQCLSQDEGRCHDGLDNDGDGQYDYGCQGASGWYLDTQTKCESAGGTWTTPDTDCTTDVSPDGKTTLNDERLVTKEVGGPTGLAFDGTDLWASFGGLYAFNQTEIRFDGEGFARINAANTADSQVFCGPAGRNPNAITYDSNNDYVWLGYKYDFVWGKMHAGLGSFRASDGGGFSQGDLVSDLTYNSGDWGFDRGVFELLYDNTTAGGPYLWATTYGQLEKFNISGSVIEDSYPMGDGSYDLAVDRVSTGNPYIWVPNTWASTVSRVTPSTDVIGTYIPKGTFVEDAVFDGTNIWMVNSFGYSIGKFRASDGAKIGDYATGYNPGLVIYDGQDIWTFNSYDPLNKHFSRIRASDGTKIGDYQRDRAEKPDSAVFDGRYIWLASAGNDVLRRIDPDGCTPDPDGNGPLIGDCRIAAGGSTSYDNLQIDGEDLDASLMVFDGQSLWTTRRNNKISKIELDGTISSSLTIPQIASTDFNVTAIEYDGNSLWLGTDYVDSNGNSLYTVNATDGQCSVSGDTCQTNADCGANVCEAVVTGAYPIYNEPGICSGGTNPDKYCTNDAMCTGGGVCNGMRSGVTNITFDGVNAWITNGTKTNVALRECEDGLDNDGDGLIDDNNDPECNNDFDLHEADTGIECSDGLDNDGNGLCDFDGAVGYPGCSGKPDPGCSSANDISEEVRRNDGHLTRMNAATGQIIESIRYGSNYCFVEKSVYDGQHLWMVAEGNCFNGQSVAQYYTGTGLGITDLASSVGLQPLINSSLAQSGSFATAGEANIGAKLTVVGDLVVQNNTWGGSADNLNDFGTSCAEGEFVKGVAPGASESGFFVEGLATSRASSIAVDPVDGNMYVVGFETSGPNWLTEKRLTSDGGLVSQFTLDDSGGQIDGRVESANPSVRARDIVYDFVTDEFDSSIFSIGGDNNGDWRIEKRSVFDADLDSGFGSGGVVLGSADSTVTGAYFPNISVDDSYIYSAGAEFNTSTFQYYCHIEKHDKLTGILDPGFGSGGILNDGQGLCGGATGHLDDIDIDGTYMYVIGDTFASTDWLIEKRNLSDGSLDAGFGSGGRLIIETGSIKPMNIIVSGGYIYIAGSTRLEKRSITDGSLDSSFGSSGVVTIVSQVTEQGLAADSSYVYVAGINGGNWSIEKYSIVDGTLDAGFGTAGIVTSVAGTLNGIDIDSTYMYLVGDESPNPWRIEKRLLSDGSMGGSTVLQLQCRTL